MSLAIWPVFKPRVRAANFKTSGEILAHEFETLDKIAHANRLTRFTAFCDDREVPEDFDGDPDDHGMSGLTRARVRRHFEL